jgi:DNA-binding NarL/FixJ family response regulator
MSIKITITDDHPLATNGIASMLTPFPQLEIMDLFNSSSALLEGLKTRQPDILLLDIMLPGQSGRDIAPVIKSNYPAVKIIALTSLDAPSMVSGMMRRGCSGYLLKDTDQETLVLAIEEVYKGHEFIEPSLKEKLLENITRFQSNKTERMAHELTQREKEILKLIVAENTTQEIADKLFISFRTVENHRYSLLQKLDVKNSVGLVKLAIQMGLAD